MRRKQIFRSLFSLICIGLFIYFLPAIFNHLSDVIFIFLVILLVFIPYNLTRVIISIIILFVGFSYVTDSNVLDNIGLAGNHSIEGIAINLLVGVAVGVIVKLIVKQ